MIDFATGYLYWVASTLVPAFVGLLLIIGANRFIQSRYLAAFAFGIFLWFFVDTIGGAATLDVNSGFGGGLAQTAVVVLFIVGLLLFFSIDRNRNIFSPDSAIGKYGMAIPFLVAVAVGIHGMGEGADYGHAIYACTTGGALDCFGGLSAGVAYVLHKGLEPMMIGACYCIYASVVRVPGTLQWVKRWVKHSFLLSLPFVIPSLVGAPVGYYIMGPGTGIAAGFDTTYFYGLGTGTSVYAAMRLAGGLFRAGESKLSNEALRIGVALVLGLLVIYVAALFHSG